MFMRMGLAMGLGLIRASKRLGPNLGPELVTDPSFNAPASWTQTAPGAISGGQAVNTTGGNGGMVSTTTAFSVAAGTVYRLTVDAQTVGSTMLVVVKRIGLTYISQTVSGPGVTTYDFTPGEANTGVAIEVQTAGAGTAWALNSVSIKAIL